MANLVGGLKKIRTIAGLGRASEWWEYKLIPATMIGYATALHAGANPWQALPGLGLLVAALIPGGIFVSVINDLTDRSDDAAAGKANRQQGTKPVLIWWMILLSLTAGIIVAWLLLDDPKLIMVYGAGWVAFSLYSLPPFRLKSRGLAGVLCDATGAHLVPTLLAVMLVCSTIGQQVPMLWLMTVGSWSFLYGLRGIIWHQLGDLNADRLSRTRTFVARFGPGMAIGVVKRVIFPLELIAIASLIIQAGLAASIAGLIMLLAYGYLVHGRIERFDMALTVVEPKPRSNIVLHEYYDVFLPIGLLLAGPVFQFETLGLLFLHCLFFPMRLTQVVLDFAKLSDPQFVPRSKRSPPSDNRGTQAPENPAS